MNKYQEIQQQLANISDDIAALQEAEIKEHRAKLEEAEAKQYIFDEASLIGFIQNIKEEAINTITRAIESGEVGGLDNDCVSLDLDGNTIEVTIDESMIAQAISDYCDDEEIVDIEEALLDAKRYHTVDRKTK